jgi:hypothetical protein
MYNIKKASNVNIGRNRDNRVWKSPDNAGEEITAIEEKRRVKNVLTTN